MIDPGRVLGIALGLLVGACSPAPERPRGDDRTIYLRPIEAVLAEKTQTWMAIDGVTGTGIGLCDSAPCLVVFVRRRTEALERAIPSPVEGYRVELRVSGTFRARDSL